MSSRDIRKARQAHGRNTLNPALSGAALDSLRAHLRDGRRVSASAPAAPAPRMSRTQSEAQAIRVRPAINVEGK
ncbi:hypothetical protein [Paraburkholderia terrae]